MKQYTYIGRHFDTLLVKEVEGVNRTTSKIDWEPSIFYEAKAGTETGYTNTSGSPLLEKRFGKIKDFNDYLKDWSGTSNKMIYGFRGVEYQYICDSFPDRDNFDHSVFNVMYFDIETERSEEYGYAPSSNPFNPVILITAYLPKGDRSIVWELRDHPTDNQDKTEYRVFDDDISMIKDFFKFMKSNSIDIISGWNTDFYDIPYLCGRLLGQYHFPGQQKPDGMDSEYRVWTDKTSYSPFGYIKKKTIIGNYGKSQVIYEIPGIESLDYMNLYKKFTYVTRESYSLNHISYCELGEKKVDYSEHKHLQSLYEKDYKKFVEYGIKDTKLVYRLEEKLKLIDLCIALAYMVGCNLNDVFSAVKTWEIYLYNELKRDGIIAPIKGRGVHKEKEFLGAFVQDPVKGKHDWVLSFDLNSLYPHIMMFANMSPDVYVEPEHMQPDQLRLYKKHKDNLLQSIEDIIDHIEDLAVLKQWGVSMTPNGAMFSNEKLGVIPKIVKKIYVTRKDCKKLMLQKKQQLEDGGKTGCHYRTI